MATSHTESVNRLRGCCDDVRILLCRFGSRGTQATNDGCRCRPQFDRFPGESLLSYEQPLAYPQNNERDEVAYAYLLDDGRLRMEFPAPHLESKFDILELKR